MPAVQNKVYRYYKYRLYPTKKQTQKLAWTLDICCKLYNTYLANSRQYFKQAGKGYSIRELLAQLARDKETHEHLNDIYEPVLQDVVFRLYGRFQKYLQRISSGEKAGFPRFKSKSRYNSITYPLQLGFEISQQGLKLSKIGTVKIKLHRPFQGTIRTCIIKRDVDRWYACFVVEQERAKNVAQNNPLPKIGIDVGISSFATLSDGTKIEHPRFLIKSERKLKRMSRWCLRKALRSSNRKKAQEKLAKLHRKIRNQRADFHHKLSRKLVNSYSLIAIEKLDIKSMARNRDFAKHIYDAGWGQFLRYLTYKAEEAGCKLVKVPPYHTSNICSRCGTFVNKSISVRIHKCPVCKLILDRDHNSAINILNRAGTVRINAWGEAYNELR